MPPSQLPIEAFPAWALLNNVDFISAEIRNIEGKGFGLVAKDDIPSVGNDVSSAKAILRIPRDLVLSAEAVEEYAKVDQNFKQLLEVAGRQAAVNAKLFALSHEYDELCEQASNLPFWNTVFSEPGTLEDWILADALYRSRCLELPQAGHAMVPGLDMANHSLTHSAYYDESPDGDVVLLPNTGSRIPSGNEITISYGEAKSAAEMLFSYGFIDHESTVRELALHLDALPDDPLGRAKIRIYNGPRTVRLSLTEQNFQWHSPFLYLLVLNEEDGLAFRVVQDTSGGRELKLLWQGEDVTKRTGEFETLIQDHDLYQVFKLRAVAVLEERVALQLDRISSGSSYGETEQLQAAASQPRAECILAAEKLRDLETQVLQGVAEALENEKARLLLDARVVTYLGSMEDAQNEQASGLSSNEEDDFS
ncbi:set domain [Trichoderma arundinaceum]|uniref:Set domain n=1 Tax=Trichoderma arundinaceum TaxID=490622 RepID=A0A395NDV7_TRIAR|nr:set domain [Trichoderma arundinaceum]